MEVYSKSLCCALLRKQKGGAVAVWHDGPRIEHQDLPDERILETESFKEETSKYTRNIGLQNVKKEE